MLDYVHKKDYPFDFFVIKVMVEDTGATIGHLPMENSRAARFVRDRGARVVSILISTNCCISQLVQDGLENPSVSS